MLLPLREQERKAAKGLERDISLTELAETLDDDRLG